ncbi:ATP-binding protein [Streptomyces sp. NBC_00654]|uniref:ATP-binding protein n=1 Tax=Streptomyces sp. NBC_00654 TaxID=2975799 RepID=UPI00225C20FE|nr:ATP-binding protein [Streptomyces sp. NBC_00654]MCX4971114.1 ATP-binding protein [Streptomyces sp. NBC_00654]
MVISPVRQNHMVLPEISPDSMEPVREIVRILLRMWRKSDLSFVAELGVTELLTNVWKHTPGGCELLIRETPDGVLVGVTDFDDALPAVKQPTEDAECGRGLFLLAELTEELHTQPLLTGKQVWFRLGHNLPDGEKGEGHC